VDLAVALVAVLLMQAHRHKPSMLAAVSPVLVVDLALRPRMLVPRRRPSIKVVSVVVSVDHQPMLQLRRKTSSEFRQQKFQFTKLFQ
jgi:hypothetical protein